MTNSLIDEWFPIETAPKDGTVIRARNPQISKWETPYVDIKWGVYYPILGTKARKDWVLVKDYDFMPMRPGTLICPQQWRHV